MLKFWPDQAEKMNHPPQCADRIRSSTEAKQKDPVTRLVGSSQKAIRGAGIFTNAMTDPLIQHSTKVLSDPRDLGWISQSADTRVIERNLSFAPLQRAEKSQHVRRIGSDIIAGAVTANDDIFRLE